MCNAQLLTTRVRELRTTAQLARLIPTGHPSISSRTLQLLEEFYKEQGMPNEAEMEMLSGFGRVPIQALEQWCKHLQPVQQDDYQQR